MALINNVIAFIKINHDKKLKAKTVRAVVDVIFVGSEFASFAQQRPEGREAG
jgi:hypothetical protein